MVVRYIHVSCLRCAKSYVVSGLHQYLVNEPLMRYIQHVTLWLTHMDIFMETDAQNFWKVCVQIG